MDKNRPKLFLKAGKLTKYLKIYQTFN